MIKINNNMNEEKNNKYFEDTKHVDKQGTEYWYARELQLVLDYKEWRKFEGVIKKAIKACENSVLVRSNILSASTKRYKCLKEPQKKLKNIN